MTVIYEVNIDTKKSMSQEISIWLKTHIEEMLNIPGFIDANLYQEDIATEDNVKLTVWYKLSSMSALKEYFNTHALNMRSKGVSKFGEHMNINRRVFTKSKLCKYTPYIS